MPNEYVEVEVVNRGNRFGNAVFIVVLGFILFFGSFLLLFWNEGRVDLSEIAKSAVEISATQTSPQAVGKLVSVTGQITSNQVLGDDLFLVPGKYAIIDRSVEMFSWREDSRTETEKRINGSETQKTTYTYTKQWNNNPANSKDFKYPSGHENPQKALPDQRYIVSDAKVGLYNVSMADFGEVVQRKTSCDNASHSTSSYPTGSGIYLADSSRLQLSPKIITLSKDVQLVDNYLFKGNGSNTNPNIGDLRICYDVIANNATVTVFGKLETANKISPYQAKKNTRFYQLFAMNRDKAVSVLKAEHNMWIWIFRLFGFLSMSFGMLMALEPINQLLKLIPFVGSYLDDITGFFTFVVGFVLTIITIILSQLIHKPLVLIVVLIITFVTLRLFKYMRKTSLLSR